MRQLIIGLGEIGTAIKTILDEYYKGINGNPVHGYDPIKYVESNSPDLNSYDAIHICFPPDCINFIELVEEYQKLYLIENGLTIIHSSVPIGTCEKLNAVSSPCRGIHPNLIPGIKTFVKYFGGKDAYRASKIFEACQVQTKVFPKAKDIEAGKLWDTTKFNWDIAFNKFLYKWCEKNGVNFQIVWEDFTRTYNEGYRELGKDKYARPYFEYVPDNVGGHCCKENLELLDSEISDFLKELNKKYGN